MKQRVFKVHFNRINMQRGNPRVWTVHTQGICYQGRWVQIHVPVLMDYDPNRRQPRALIRGKGVTRQIGETIIITKD